MPGMRARAWPTWSGSSNGPPWQSTMISVRTERPASAIAMTRVDRLVERERHAGADRAGGGQADVRHQLVRAGLGHRLRLVGVEHVGRGEQVQLVREPDHLDLFVVAHAGRLEVGPEVAVDQPDRREVLDAGEAHLLELA